MRSTAKILRSRPGSGARYRSLVARAGDSPRRVGLVRGPRISFQFRLNTRMSGVNGSLASNLPFGQPTESLQTLGRPCPDSRTDTWSSGNCREAVGSVSAAVRTCARAHHCRSLPLSTIARDSRRQRPARGGSVTAKRVNEDEVEHQNWNKERRARRENQRIGSECVGVGRKR